VQLCRTESALGAFGLTRESYDPDGNLIERWHCNPDGREWSHICRYSHDRKLVEKEYRGISIGSDRKFSYHHDAAGRLERVLATSEAGAERIYESYRYDAQGLKTVTFYPDRTPAPGTVGVSVEAMLHWHGDAVAVMTVFDEADRPARTVFYDENDRAIRRVVFRYDNSGNLVEEGEMEPGGAIRQDFRNVYRYDASGRQIEAEMHWYDFGGQTRKRTYNEFGDVTEESRYPHEAQVKLFEQHDWATRYTYRYDDRGNWIERITATGSLPDGPFTDCAHQRRELSYYD